MRKRRALVRAAIAAVVITAVSVGAFALAAGPRYKPPRNYDAGGSAYPVAVADFNRDGRTDTVVGNEEDDNVTVLLGMGHQGKFESPHDYPAGDYPFGIAVADFNGDDKKDLAVADNGGDAISILKGDGNGHFSAPAVISTVGAPVSVAAGDFNGDHDPDLAVAEEMSSKIEVLLGKNGAGFHAPVGLSVGVDTESIAVADADRDGKQDVFALTYSDGFDVFRGKGHGTFKAPKTFESGADSAYGMAVGDFSGDHRPDVVAFSCEGAEKYAVSVAKAHGLDYGAPHRGTGGACVYEPEIVDYNHDGKLDLAVTREGGSAIRQGGRGGAPNGGAIDLLAGRGNGRFRRPKHVPATTDAYSIESARLNGDKAPDFIVPDYGIGKIAIVLSK